MSNLRTVLVLGLGGAALLALFPAMTNNTTKFTFVDLLALAQSVGFVGADAVTAAGIALAESSGNPASVGDLNLTPGGSVGLWQINLRWHPDADATQLRDPNYNARFAFKVYTDAGNTFTPWSTFNTKKYLAYVPSEYSTGISA